MGVGLRLIGRHEGGADLLSRVDDWIRQECREAWMAAANVTDADGRPALQVLLHPTAESVEIVSWDPKTLVVSAKTSSVGPGYHLYLCDVVKRIGEALSVAWDPPDAERQTGDDTGFFHAGDVLEGDARPDAAEHAGSAFAEVHRLAVGALGLPKEEE